MLQMVVFPKYNNLALCSVDFFFLEKEKIKLILEDLDFQTILLQEKNQDPGFQSAFQLVVWEFHLYKSFCVAIFAPLNTKGINIPCSLTFHMSHVTSLRSLNLQDKVLLVLQICAHISLVPVLQGPPNLLPTGLHDYSSFSHIPKLMTWFTHIA